MSGQLILYALLFLTFLLTIPAASHTGLETWSSLAASSTAFVAMALNQYLATRPKYIEGMFGGLDRMYQVHRKMGIIALVGILIHYFVTPNFKGQVLSSGLNNLAKEVAEFAFYGLVALCAISLVKRIPYTKIGIPYHLWKQSHRFMGLLFIAIAFHQMFIKKPFDGTAMLSAYLNVFALIGIVSFLITQIGPMMRRKKFEVSYVEKMPAATLIEAKPIGSPLKSKRGQFAFLRIPKKGLGEAHPFTIAGQGKNGEIKFAVKPLGDFTAKLREKIAVGDILEVAGGYGRFLFSNKQDRQLWLAGGIGITPLLSMAEGLTKELKEKICMVHCVRDASEAVEIDLLRNKAREVENFEFHLFDSEQSGHLNFETLSKMTSMELDGAGMWFCGPPPLRTAIEKGAKAAGSNFSAIHFEKFEFR